MKFQFACLVILLGISHFFGFAKKADPDQMVLEQLRKAGSDLSKPHKIEFFLYFPTQSFASKASVKIKEMGFDVEMKPATKGPDWLCFATKTMTPELNALQKIRRDFNALASADGGEYDGWGTAIVQ
jgi:regulator of RNase E activity RraB